MLTLPPVKVKPDKKRLPPGAISKTRLPLLAASRTRPALGAEILKASLLLTTGNVTTGNVVLMVFPDARVVKVIVLRGAAKTVASNTISSAPAAALASVMACLSDPAPLSPVFVTVKVAARALKAGSARVPSCIKARNA